MSEEIKEEEQIVDPDMLTDEQENIDAEEYYIKETNITLNTLNLGSASGTTDLINGKLECVIIDTDKPVQILLYLEDYPNITLFSSNRQYITKQVYLPLRTFAISPIDEKFTHTDAKWCLNDKIKCEVLGPVNATVNIKLRYC